jgi:hypothetical protein
MIRIVMRKVYFRPTISPIRPKKRAPKGRIAKPAANARRAKTNPAVSLMPEKNCRLMMPAREPY